MEKYTNNNPSIDDLLTLDWGDENNQWSGTQVQKGIKNAFNSKLGYTTVYKKYICNFKSFEDYEKWMMAPSLSDTQYLIGYSKIDYANLVNSASVAISGQIVGKNISELDDSTLVTVTKETAKINNLSFHCSYLDDEDISHNVEQQITWYIDLNGVTVKTGTTRNDVVLDTIDLSQYVTSEANQYLSIYVTFHTDFTGDYSSKGTPKSFKIQLNDYSISFANDYFWTTPWILTEDASVSLWMKGSTNGDKVRTFVEFYNQSGILIKKVSNDNLIPSNTAAVNFDITNTTLNTSPALSQGVYKIRIWFEYNGSSSPVISKNIMIKASENDIIEKVCANLVSQQFTNYTSVPICSYIVNGNIKGITESIGSIVNERTLDGSSLYTFSSLLNIDDSENDLITASVTLANSNNTSEIYFSEDVIIDNRNRFSAASGAAITIDPAGLKSNSNVINSVNNKPLTTIWNGFNWSDNDGWIQEKENDTFINVLKILKESSASIDGVFAQNSQMSSGDFTLEIMYKVTNSTNDDDSVIRILSNETERTYNGLNITATTVDFRPIQSQYNLDTVLPLATDKIIHLTIVYNGNFQDWASQLGKANFPLTKIYINGKIAREIFSSQIEQNLGQLVLGGQDSDLTIYKIRKYNVALSDQNVLNNFLNCYNTDLEDRILINTRNSEVFSGSINFNKMKGKYNCFVLSSESYPDDLPSFFKKESDTKCVLPGFTNSVSVNDALIELYWDKENFPGNEDVKIQITGKDGKLQYQGSSSKDYYRWNWRSKFTSACTTMYEDGSTKDNGSFTMYTSYKENSDGSKTPTNGIECSVLTAKKNYASSMQSHKMGFVNSYNDLYNQMATHSNVKIGELTLDYEHLLSPIMAGNTESSKSNKRNATWQAPFFGFIKVGDDYKFVGLYTIGPDKGDKKITGFDTKVYRRLVEFEGANQDPRFTNFMLPWNEDSIHIAVNDKGDPLYVQSTDSTEEKIGAWELIKFNPVCYTGELIGTLDGVELPSKFDGAIVGSTFVVADDYKGTAYIPGAYYTLDEEGNWTRSKEVEFTEGDTTDMMWQLRRDLMPTYKFVFDHNINIRGLEHSINTEFIPNDELYCLYWFDGDDSKKLFYYNSDTKSWEVATHVWYDSKGIKHTKECTVYDGFDKEIPNENSLSVAEKNEAYINARAEHFRDHCSEYFNLLDTLIWFENVEIYAGTDERAKNIYPYKIGSVKYKKDADGNYVFDKVIGENTWRWRLDDADTRFDIDNEGRATKKYYIESGDNNANGSWPERSAMFNLFNHEAFYELKKNVFAHTLQAMCELMGEALNLTTIDKFHQKYFWDWSADYFTEMGYNEDAIFSYDQAKACQQAGLSLKVDPITQSYGDHKLAEQRFINERIKYLASKYVYVPILGSDVFDLGRGVSGNIKVTYDGWIYPTYYVNGNNNESLVSSKIRLEKGGTFEVNAQGSGTSSSAIGSKSLISDVGNGWADINTTADAVELSFSDMPKLKTLNVSGYEGSFYVKNLANLQELNISNCKNIKSADQIDLSASTHLKKLNASGANLNKLRVASGAPVSVMNLPDTMTELYLDKLHNLKNDGLLYNGWNSSLKDVFIRDCDSSIKPLNRIFNTMKTNPGQLECVYITGLNETWNMSESPENMKMLKEFATSNIGGYQLNTTTNEFVHNPKVSGGKPTLNGTIAVNCDYFLNDLNSIKKNLAGNINIKTSNKYYALVRFNNSMLQEQIHNYLMNNSYDNTMIGDLNSHGEPEYQNYIVWNNVTSDNNKIYNLITETKTVVPTASDTTLGSNADLSDWGTWFENSIPKFMEGHECSNVKLSVNYTLPNYIYTHYLGSGSNSSINKYSELNINAEGVDAILAKRQYNYGSSSDNTYLFVDDMKVNCKKMYLKYTYDIWNIKNLYLNSSEVPEIDDGSLFGSNDSTNTGYTKIENIYINQNLYWQYLGNANLNRRLTNYRSNYIPYDFLNNQIGEIPEHPTYKFSDAYMLLSKAYFRWSNPDSQPEGTKAIYITFTPIVDGYLFGNKNLNVKIENSYLVVSYVGSKSTAVVTGQSPEQLNRGEKYTVRIELNTEGVQVVVLKDGETYDFTEDGAANSNKFTLLNGKYVAMKTPFAVGTYNTSNVKSTFEESWEPYHSNFIGNIFNISISGIREGSSQDVNIVPSYNISQGNYFQGTNSTNLIPESESYYYKTFNK